MSQLRAWLWQYFEEHGRLPEPSSTFSAMLDMALEEEIVSIAMDVAAMRAVNFLRDEGRDLPAGQQVQGIEPFLREAVRLIVSREATGWRPIG